MNKLLYFHRQALVALIFCPLLFFSMDTVEFNQPKLFKPSEYQLTPQFFKFISSGFWPATADLMWMQTLQRVGSGVYTRDIMLETLGFYKLSTDLDPKFYQAYDQAAVVFAFYFEAAYPALEMIDRGIKVYESGDYPPKFWTHPYSLYLHRAYVNAFLRNDWKQAAQDYVKAAYSPGSPDYLQSMKIWLQKEGSEKKLAIKVLKILINSTTDPVIKLKYQEKLKKYE